MHSLWNMLLIIAFALLSLGYVVINFSVAEETGAFGCSYVK